MCHVDAAVGVTGLAPTQSVRVERGKSTTMSLGVPAPDKAHGMQEARG